MQQRQEIISLVSFGDYGGTTNPRRASSLRALVNWVIRWAGIPVRREDKDDVQLYIPWFRLEKSPFRPRLFTWRNFKALGWF